GLGLLATSPEEFGAYFGCVGASVLGPALTPHWRRLASIVDCGAVDIEVPCPPYLLVDDALAGSVSCRRSRRCSRSARTAGRDLVRACPSCREREQRGRGNPACAGTAAAAGDGRRTD